MAASSPRAAATPEAALKIADNLDLSYVNKLDLGEMRRLVDKLIAEHGEDSTIELVTGWSKPDSEADRHTVPQLNLVYRREETEAERAKRMKAIGMEF